MMLPGKEYREDRFRELTDQLHRIFGEPVMIEIQMKKDIPGTGAVKRKAIESRINKREIKELRIS